MSELRYYPSLLELLDELFDQIFPESERRLAHIHVSPCDFLVIAEPYLEQQSLSKLREKAERIASSPELLPCFPPLFYIEWFENLYEILLEREKAKVHQP
jgi:hypothetical protein